MNNDRENNQTDLKESHHNRLVIEPCIGLTWRPLPEHINIQALNKNNLLTMSLLDVLEEQHTSVADSSHHSPEFKNIEAKLNLLLHLVAQLLGPNQNLPESLQVKLSIHDVEWLSDKKIEQGQNVLIDLYLDNEYQHALQLRAQVHKVKLLKDLYLVHAQFSRLDEVLREQLEKWIFRYHRRDIALARGR